MEDFLSLITFKSGIHYALHFLFPAAVAWGLDRQKWKKIWMLFLATMLVDADHLLATPIFDPNRCSIGFHVLHSEYAIAVYALVFAFVRKKIPRIIALGLLMHMATDLLDCYLA